MKQIKIGKDAALELEEAAVWYEQEQTGSRRQAPLRLRTRYQAFN